MVTKYQGVPAECPAEMVMADGQASDDHLEAYCDSCERRHGFSKNHDGV